MDVPKKSLGQHWLHDAAALNAVCAAAEVKNGEVVLEIGPGTGTLTDKLLEHSAEVVALEVDEDLIKRLNAKYQGRPSHEIVIQSGDIRTYDFSALANDYKIVANIPYYLTAYLLRRLTGEQAHKPSVAALLVQKEVAERVAAGPGSMSLVAVATQFYYEVSLGQVVPAQLFTPPPKVDSQILVLKQRPEPLFPDIDSKKFFHIVKAGFSQRRKTLENSLSAGLHISKDQAKQMLEHAGIVPSTRPQNLSLEDWRKLALSVALKH